ncbi:hypothetical protein KEM54_006197 [Ascosphaera aggregata]|nr:hypothetical protein KEM54_006197 [Ascosphaera aggregata]
MESDAAPMLPILRPLSRFSASLFDGFSRRRSFQNVKKLRDDKAKGAQFLQSLDSVNVQQPARTICTSRPSSVYSHVLDDMSITIYSDSQSGHSNVGNNDTITLDHPIQQVFEAEALSLSDYSGRNDNSDAPSTVSDICDSYDTSIYTDIMHMERDSSPDDYRMSSAVASGHAATSSPPLPMPSLNAWLHDEHIGCVLPEIKPHESIMPSLKRALDSYPIEDVPNDTSSLHLAHVQCAMTTSEVSAHRRESTVASTGWDRLFKQREAHKQIQPLRPRSHQKEASIVSVPKTAHGTSYTKWFKYDTDEHADADLARASLVETKFDGKVASDDATRSARSSASGMIPIALDSPMCSSPQTIFNIPSPFPNDTHTSPIPYLLHSVEIVTPTLPQFTPEISFQENATHHEPVYYEPVSYQETQPARSPPSLRPFSRTKQIGMKANHIRLEASKMKQKVFRISSAPTNIEASEDMGGRARHLTWMPVLSNRESNTEGTFLSRIIKRFSLKGNMVNNHDRKRANRPAYNKNNNTNTLREERDVTKDYGPRPSSNGMIEEHQKRLQVHFPNLRSSSARDVSLRHPPTNIHVMHRKSSGTLRGPVASLPQMMSAHWNLGINPSPRTSLPCTPGAFGPSPVLPEFSARISATSYGQRMERPVMPPPISIPTENGSQENCGLPSSSSGN